MNRFLNTHFCLRLTVAWSLAFLGCAALSGCRPGVKTVTETVRGGHASEPTRVVVTVGMLGDLVREVGGSQIQVQQLMGSGIDPHLYKPTRDDVQAILAADVVFYVGLMLEGRMTETLSQVSRNKPTIAIGERLDPQNLIWPVGTEGHPDPHVWMDVSLWIEALGVVRDTLSDLYPRHAQRFRERAQAYATRLTELHDYARVQVQSIPERARVLITSHDAFQYFGRAYGLEVHGIQGISTESEAGLAQVNRLVDLIIERQVQAVFVESSVSQKSIRSLIQGARARGATLRVGGTLFSDAMGPPGTYEGTYEGMLDHNITTVVRGLGGRAPPRGMRGKLPHPID